MTPEVVFEAVHAGNQETYSQVGIRSYIQHYLHLWKNADPGPYIRNGFSRDAVARELKDPGNAHYLILRENVPVGIIKIIRDREVSGFSPQHAMLLERLYLLQEYSGKGIGKQALDFVTDEALKMGKRVLWLDTMRKGPALLFYRKHGFVVLEEKTLHYPDSIEEERPMYILIKSLKP